MGFVCFINNKRKYFILLIYKQRIHIHMFKWGSRQVVMARMRWADKYFGTVLTWLKLPNSGDVLKILILNYNWKIISGWTNHSGKVISQDIIEREMDNRGSKSEFILSSVKEQRVDGSWLLKIWGEGIRSLRCTLMDFERNYQVKVLTNQLLNKFYSTLNNQKFNFWFITGFTDAEGSFIISIYKDAKSKLKWRVSAYFSIHVYKKDLPLLKLIQKILSVGIVRKNNENTVLFRVSDIKELQIIINLFKNYPLISAKYLDFLYFEQCLELIKEKVHLTEEGLLKIVSLKANLNKGLSKELLEAFPNVENLDRLEYKFKGIPDPSWVSGFASGDSTFSVSIEKGTTKLGKRVRLIFGICLHIREKYLLIGISKYFNSLYLNLNEVNKESSIHCNKNKNTALLQIKSTSDIYTKVIPFFTEYPILGIKLLDFEDFKKVAELVKNKEHLKIDGLNKIMKIVDRMNLAR